MCQEKRVLHKYEYKYIYNEINIKKYIRIKFHLLNEALLCGSLSHSLCGYGKERKRKERRNSRLNFIY